MNNKKSCLTNSLIQYYVDNELSGNDRFLIEKHLESCGECALKVKNHSDWIDDFKSTLNQTHKFEVEIPEFKEVRLEKKKNLLFPLIRIAAVFILLFGSYLIFRTNRAKEYKPTVTEILLWEEATSGDDANYNWHNRNVTILLIDKNEEVKYLKFK